MECRDPVGSSPVRPGFFPESTWDKTGCVDSPQKNNRRFSFVWPADRVQAEPRNHTALGGIPRVPPPTGAQMSRNEIRFRDTPVTSDVRRATSNACKRSAEAAVAHKFVICICFFVLRLYYKNNSEIFCFCGGPTRKNSKRRNLKVFVCGISPAWARANSGFSCWLILMFAVFACRRITVFTRRRITGKAAPIRTDCVRGVCF